MGAASSAGRTCERSLLASSGSSSATRIGEVLRVKLELLEQRAQLGRILFQDLFDFGSEERSDAHEKPA